MSLNQMIKVQIEGEVKEIYLDSLDELLEVNMKNNERTFRDAFPFQLWVNSKIIIQSSNLNNFSRNFQYLKNNSIYFNSQSVFKLNAEKGQINLFKI